MKLVSPKSVTPANSPELLLFYGQDWNRLKARLDTRYAQLTEADLAYIPGEEEALFARMEERTMESRVNLERFLREECGCSL